MLFKVIKNNYLFVKVNASVELDDLYKPHQIDGVVGEGEEGKELLLVHNLQQEKEEVD